MSVFICTPSAYVYLYPLHAPSMFICTPSTHVCVICTPSMPPMFICTLSMPPLCSSAHPPSMSVFIRTLIRLLPVLAFSSLICIKSLVFPPPSQNIIIDNVDQCSNPPPSQNIMWIHVRPSTCSVQIYLKSEHELEYRL